MKSVANGINNKEVIKYYVCCGAWREKHIEIDNTELQKKVLLQIYYSEMLKIKANIVNMSVSLMEWVYINCAAGENIVTKDCIVIEPVEILRILAKMYDKGLIDTEEDSYGGHFVLKEEGKILCTKFLNE